RREVHRARVSCCELQLRHDQRLLVRLAAAVAAEGAGREQQERGTPERWLHGDTLSHSPAAIWTYRSRCGPNPSPYFRAPSRLFFALRSFSARSRVRPRARPARGPAAPPLARAGRPASPAARETGRAAPAGQQAPAAAPA